MGRISLTEGDWHTVANEQEHQNLKAFGRLKGRPLTHIPADVQLGEYSGPGEYLHLQYSQPCPRGCCRDSVRKVLSAADVTVEVVAEIRNLAQLLAHARKDINGRKQQKETADDVLSMLD